MKREQLPIYALALAVLIVGLTTTTGISVTSLIVPLLVLACPVMMFFMMRGMHGDAHGDTRKSDGGTTNPVRRARRRYGKPLSEASLEEQRNRSRSEEVET